jgi:hypothetical protein
MCNCHHSRLTQQLQTTCCGGYFKEKTFAHLYTTEELTAQIQYETVAILVAFLWRVKGNLTARLEWCIAREGALLQDIIFKQ